MTKALHRTLTAALCAAALLSVTACSTTSPDSYRRDEAQRPSTVQDATVLSVRDVTIEGSQSGIGALAGGVAGGVAGSTVGGQREHVVVGTIGAIVGAVVGNFIESGTTKEQADEILLQIEGKRRVVVQAKGTQVFRPGDAVIVVESAGKLRVIKPASH